LYRNPACSSLEIRNYAMLITGDNERRPDVPEWKLRIPQLDLFKINHFDNKNRRTGLKWCEFMLDLDNIEDMPSQGEGSNWEEMVLSYNMNDVVATKALYLKTLPMIETRRNLTKMYGLNMMNYSNTKIGSELLLDLYCKKTRRNKNDVKSLRTYRKVILGKDVVFSYISFKSNEFNYILDYFKNLTVVSTKKEEEVIVKYNNFEYVYGKGGIHGSLNNCIIESDENYSIIDADVSSLYPSIAIVNNLYPKHLGPEFYEVYKNDIVDVRLTEKRKKEKGNKAIVDGFKEAANASYGNSNSEFSWLYDPLYTMKTTVNGQLMISMLCETLVDIIPQLTMIQANTDGITVKLPKTHIKTYHDICNEWMNLTKLELEFTEYTKMIIRDVNSYIAVYTTGKSKLKGAFEYKDIPLHKNKSHSIIPYAFYEYMVNNKPVRETILSHRNIFDFCAGVKAKKSEKSGNCWYELHSIEDRQLKIEKLSKTVRYFISKKGKQLIKKYEDGSQEFVEAPIHVGKLKKFWNVTYFNKKLDVNNFEDYNIDYSYYIREVEKWISLFNINKLTLF